MRQLFLLSLSIVLIWSCEPSDDVIVTSDTPKTETSIWKDTVTLTCRTDTVSSVDSLWQLWKQYEPKHYQYQVTNMCFCESIYFDYVIEVYDSKLDTAYPIDYNEEQYGKIPYEQVRRSAERLLIDSLFNLQVKFDSYNPESTSKTFHDQFHFPCYFFYDFDFGVADEEFGLQISSFIVAE